VSRPWKTLARLQDQADAYAALDPRRPVQPALELIAILAQFQPGQDGTHRAHMPADLIDEFADLIDAFCSSWTCSPGQRPSWTR
jgi:hypothetical protein